MASTLDMALEIDQRLTVDSSDDDEDVDSITDSSSVDEERHVPRGLPISKLPTGLCYDERMRYHSEVAAMSAESVHPEDPRRIYYIYKELCDAGLVAEIPGVLPIVNPPLLRIDAREATEEECCIVHTSAHWDFVKRTADLDDEALIDLSENPNMDSIYFNRLSYFSGKLSAGGAIETCKAVVSRRVKNAIAVIRPPGHHAEVSRTMGFCLFNNVCIASKVCQQTFGEQCRKILILDWDVHHGNGCQNAFYDDPNILYISLHVHMNGHFYPSGAEGNMYHCGEGYGEGKNINIPWETKGMGDGDYMFAFQHVVMPIATEFDPDFVIVAAGFDAAAGDELGGCFVSPACYAHMTHMLMSLADGKVAVCLEGGYNFQAISKSALAVTRTLMGEPPDRLNPTSATQSAIKVVHQVRQVQSKYWKSMFPKDPASAENSGGQRLHDIIREWQAMHLYDRYKLTELHIYRDNISRSFQKQVLASPAHDSRKHLIVFFHDPPDLLGPQDPMTNRQKPHETWMLDGMQSYLERALKEGIAVIDINIPAHITITRDPRIDPEGLHRNLDVAYASQDTDVARLEAEKLAKYVWENYVEPYDFDGGIWLIGAGFAFHAVARLISENDQVYHRLRGVVSFICANPVRPVTSTTNHWIGEWYRSHSKVFVASDHNIWTLDDRGKKVSKRYGKVTRSPESILNAMMKAHETEIFDWIHETGDFDVDINIGDADIDADSDGSDVVKREGEFGGGAGGVRAMYSAATTVKPGYQMQAQAQAHGVIGHKRGLDSTDPKADTIMD